MTKKTLTKDPLNLIITGVGGQGNVMISLTIGSILVREGYIVTVGETYGVSQRGGPVMSHVRISKETQYSPLILEGQADVILGMEPVETLRILGKYGNPNVVTLFNPRPIYSIDVISGDAEYPDLAHLIDIIKGLSAKTWIVNATEEAEKMGQPIVANTILIGSLIGLDVLPLDKESIEQELRDRFPKAFELNMRALEKGMELIRG